MNTTVMKKIKGQTWLDDILCSATSADVVDQAEQDIAALLRERHHIRAGADDDFNLRNPIEIAEAVKQSTQTMEVVLAAIASVSLLVGGIGIMNIMLVLATERTREIGLRLAVGARGRDVLRQFLVEAVILSLIGGAIGLGIGAVSARAISDMLQWPTRVSSNVCFCPHTCGSVVLSTIVGVGMAAPVHVTTPSSTPVDPADSASAARWASRGELQPTATDPVKVAAIISHRRRRPDTWASLRSSSTTRTRTDLK